MVYGANLLISAVLLLILLL